MSAALEAARRAIRAVIDAAKKLATQVIERARQAIVATIQAVGEALMAIGDALLAAFPGLRDRFRGLIKGLVDRAVSAVNAIADKLKQGVQKALDMLGQGLDAALGLLEKGLHAIVDAVGSVVQGAIKFAEGMVQAFAAFAALIKDIAASPGAWLSALGAAVVDGIRNHLWGALKTAVNEWLKSKVIEMLGIGGVVVQILMQGGIDLGGIAKMAWEGLKSAIPVALITILVEKLVSMIVPAAGAVMAIIEGLQAAWGTLSRIVAAMGAFVAFLKAVKGGQAGPQFAQMLALAAVVVLDFVSNWLLRKLMSAARKIGRKLKALAKKLAKKFKNRGRRGRGRRGRERERDRDANTKKKRDEDEDETMAQKQARLRRAAADVRKLFRGKRRVRPLLRLSLARIKRRHRLTQLRAKRAGAGRTSTYEITATINPKLVFTETAASDDAAKFASQLNARCDNLDSQKAAEAEGRRILRALFPNAGYRVVWRHMNASEWSVTLYDAKGQSFTVGVLQKLRNDGQPVAKTGPKTDPDSAHNQKIREVIEKYVADGWRLEGGGLAQEVEGGKTEQVLKTAGGIKEKRRPDITLENPKTGEKLHINVGLGMKQRRKKEDGSGYHELQAPIKREREAQQDIESVLDENERFMFVAYNF